MKYLFILLFIFLINNVFCKSDSTENSVIVQPIQSKDSTCFNEANAYKMLYENQVASNKSILSTIFYALGGLGGAVLLVFASNWWFNDKKVKDLIKEIDTKVLNVKKETYAELSEKINTLSNEKYEDIKQLQNKLQEEVNANIITITSKFKEFTEIIRTEIKQDNKELLNNYQKQLEAFNSNYIQQISSLNESVNLISVSLNEKLKDKEEMLKGLINSEANTRILETNSIKEKIHRTEFWVWDGRGVPGNALRAQMNELEYRLSNKGDLTFYLNQILDTSKKLKWFSKYDKENIKNLLEKVPEKYIEIIDEILLVIGNVPEE